MYLATLFLPLIGFLSIILFGRFLNKFHILIMNMFSLVLALFCSILAVKEVILSNSPVIVDLGS